MDYRARWYIPALGRFASADTIIPNPGAPQSLNRYSYAGNNPLVYIDPDGHNPIVAALILVGILVAAEVIAHETTPVQTLPAVSSYVPPLSVGALEAYQQYQPFGSPSCADYSVAMAYNILRGRFTPNQQGLACCAQPPLPPIEGSDVTPLIDRTFFGRFPRTEMATPFGVNGALNQLQIAYRFTLHGSVDELGDWVGQGNLALVSIGQREGREGYEGETWGHVKVVVGYDPMRGFAFLDPGLDPSDHENPRIVWLSEEQFLDEWWYGDIHPMWLLYNPAVGEADAP